ncbi:hypothetical protein [Marinicrinis lubricantis]|uniref:YceG-like family protein n=1 Tax=Marinicrinis lubricantis TaxID=2086470 RepID=A0ABW1IME1_9BACL
MFKNKWFLRGLGIGMFLAAVLIFFMQSAQSMKDTPIADVTEMTENALKSEAERQGYKLYPMNETWYSETQLQERIQAALDEREPVQPEKEIIHSFYISYMMSTTQVSELLLAMGLITDKAAFLQEMINEKLTDNLQVGVFEFTGQPSMDEIIETITTPR